MSSIRKRLVACILTVGMLLTSLPLEGLTVLAADVLSAQEAREKMVKELIGWPGINHQGHYMDAALGEGMNEAYFLNGGFSTSFPTVTFDPVQQKPFKNENTKIVGSGSDVSIYGSGSATIYGEDIERYNMFKNFGITRMSNATVGFYPITKKDDAGVEKTDSRFFVNFGTSESDKNDRSWGASLTLGGGDCSWPNGYAAKIKIAENPTLRALAESGDLYFYFSGMVAGSQQVKKGPKADNHTHVKITLKMGTEDHTEELVSHWDRTYDGGWDDDEHEGEISTRKLADKYNESDKKYDIKDGWVRIESDSVIEFTMYDHQGSKGDYAWNGGLANGLLLFYKASNPVMEPYEFETNGDMHYNNERQKNEILLDASGNMKLDITFSEAVRSYLSAGTLNADSGAGNDLMKELTSRTLFTNTSGTGFYRQGEPTVMPLTEVKESSGTTDTVVKSTDGDVRKAIKGPFKSLTYSWTAQNGDYFGNNPVPTGGDWAGKVSSSNLLCLMDALSLFNLHDLAGNPVQLKDKTGTSINTMRYDLSTELSPDMYGGTVKLTQKGTSYEQTGDPFGDYNVIIDAVKPSYSVTSNGIQPDILTQLVLNKGDEFDLTVNFSEGVQVQRYNSSGQSLGWLDENTYLEFNNGMKATYVSGAGTKNWVFHVEVPADVTAERGTLEIEKVGNEQATGTYFITDYVGNLLTQDAGDKQANSSIEWAQLSVDNTAPEITLESNGEYITIKATDAKLNDEDGSAGSGIFHPKNTTGGQDNATGVTYYIWVKGTGDGDSSLVDDAVEQTIAVMSANNYAAVKKYSLTGIQPDGYPTADGSALAAANNESALSVPKGATSGEWYLVVFTADMTWDSARQIIQYDKLRAVKNTEEGMQTYYGKLLGALNLADDGQPYQLLTEAPDDWAATYFNYFVKQDSVYSRIPEAKPYPDWEKDTYYEYSYQELTGRPGDWEENYTNYYVKETVESDSGDASADIYTKLRTVTGVPEFKKGTYYTKYKLLTGSAPTDWGQGATCFYRLKESTDAAGYVLVDMSGVPEYAADLYYEQGTQDVYTVTASQPGDWSERYTDYYTESGGNYTSVTEGSAPTWQASTYYKKTQKTVYTKLTSKTAPTNWSTTFTNYYTADMEISAPTWEENKYYVYDTSSSRYTLLSSNKPEGWDTNWDANNEKNYKTYYQYQEDGKQYIPVPAVETPTGSYTKVVAEIPDYSAGNYYRMDSSTTLDEKPDDWDRSYTRYYTDEECTTPVTAVTAPTFEKGKHYEYALKELTAQPEDWKIRYGTYFTVDRKSVTVTDQNRTADIPEWAADTYYQSAEFIEELAGKLTAGARRDAFREAMLKANTWKKKVDVISAYHEFADAIHQADQECMVEAGKYESWADSDYRKDDSNWTWQYTSSKVDKDAPTVTLVGVQNDGTNEVQVAATVADASSINSVGWKLVPKDEELTDGNWLAIAAENVHAPTFVTANYVAQYTLPSGEYDLYVETSDACNNTAAVKLTTVKICLETEVHYELVLPEDAGTQPYQTLSGLTVRFSGNVAGRDVFVRDFKLWYAVDQNSSKAEGADGWTELTVSADGGTLKELPARSYALPKISGYNGAVFVHLKYSYKDAGNKTTVKTAHQTYVFSNVVADVLFNKTAESVDSISVQIVVTASGKKTQYMWLKDSAQGPYIDGNSVVIPAGAAWSDYNGASLTLTSAQADTLGSKSVRLWALVTNTDGTEPMLRSEAYSFSGSVAAGEAPKPNYELLAVPKVKTKLYAVVKLDLPEEQRIPGAEYSYATLKKGASSCKWNAWQPFESIANIPLGTTTKNLELRIKFRMANGEETPAGEYIRIVDFDTVSGGPYTTVERSSIKQVGPATGVTLKLTDKGASKADRSPVVKANGCYEYPIPGADYPLYVVVANINSTPPAWSVSYSTVEPTNAFVVATLKTDKNVSVTAMEYTKAGAGGSTPVSLDPSTTYRFTENGTVEFHIRDQAGNTNTATATVGWIDRTPVTVNAEADYSEHKTVMDGNTVALASGVTMRISATVPISCPDIDQDAAYELREELTQNGTYTREIYDELGNRKVVTLTVDNLLTAQPAPTVKSVEKVTVQREDDPVDPGNKVNVEVAKVVITGKIAGYDKGNKLYDGAVPMTLDSGEHTKVSNVVVNGGTFLEAEYTCDASGNYTITRYYSSNGLVTGCVCDALGNKANYEVRIDCLDVTPPQIRIKSGSVPSAPTGTPLDRINWKDYCIVSDDGCKPEEITVTAKCDNYDADVAGTYFVTLTAADKAGKTASVNTYLYILPSDGILVTEKRGVLFYSGSKDSALLADDDIRLNVSRYNLMKYGFEQKTVENKKATFEIYIQKGLYREGQLKYLQTVRLKDQQTAEVHITPEMLDGSGWYTIIVRNSERERELTTFFISTTISK